MNGIYTKISINIFHKKWTSIFNKLKAAPFTQFHIEVFT